MTELEKKLKGHVGLERVLITLWEIRTELANTEYETFEEQCDRNAKVSALDMAYIEVERNLNGEQMEFKL